MLRAATMVLFAIFVPLLTLAIARPRIMATAGTEAMQMVNPGDCAQPCWQGIQPGKTTLKQAQAILTAADMAVTQSNYIDATGRTTYQLCWQRAQKPYWKGCVSTSNNPYPDGVVQDIDFLYPEITLGEAVQVFGDPLGTRLYWRTDTMDGIVYFRGNVQADIGLIYVAMTDRLRAFDPHMQIVRLSYIRPDQAPGCKPYPWHGFGPPSLNSWKCQQ
jgi:hypothetical protein